MRRISQIAFSILFCVHALLTLTQCDDRATNTPTNLSPRIEIIHAADHIQTSFSTVISFRLVDPENKEITWTAGLDDGAGSKISPRAGGPISSGSNQEIVFEAGTLRTKAKITLLATDASGKNSDPVVLPIDVEIF